MSIGTLTFRARHNVDVPVDVDGGVVLRGELEWIATGPATEVDALLNAVGEAVGERAADETLLLRFGNAVGRFRISGLGVLEVQCGKWDEEVFDAMLEDLTRVALGLPFSATQGASLPHDHALADRDDVLLHAFLYARHIVLTQCRPDALGPALEAIIRDPHRQFLAERERIGLARARRVDARTVQRIAVGAEPLVKAGGAARHSHLARVLDGRLPATVDAPRVEHSIDTAENRFVFSFLKQVLALIDRVETLAGSKPKSSFWRFLLVDCTNMRRELAPYIRHDIWNGIGAMTQVPIASSVLQRRRGYKDVLRHHFALRAAARLPIDETVLTSKLLGMKDVASLYELWCFFAVVRAIEDLIGPPDSAEHTTADEVQVDVRRGLKVLWRNDIEVFYNVSFSRKAEPGRRSSSLLLRPDIVIQIRRHDVSEVHVLDAKLRVKGATSIADNDDEDFGEALSFKRDDVAKMHAYRDALPSVRSAFVLYPGHESVKFVALDVGAADIDAVGAIPLVPGEAPMALKAWLRVLLGLRSEGAHVQ
jgi:predicted component of viral defense system (DUF524 family)